MVAERLTQLLRNGALAIFSIFLASCGSGDGKSSVDVSQEETTASKLQLVFADYFGDPPDTNSRGAKTIAKAPLAAGNWVIDTGYGENNDGWGNGEWQLYRNDMENVFTENGNLVLRAKCDDPPDYVNCNDKDGSITSGKVLTKNRIDVKYGNVRARIKMPSGAGMWPAFWMLGSDIDDRPWPAAGEIDIVEMHYFFSDTRTTHFTLHWAGPQDTDGMPGACSGTTPPNPAEVHLCKTDSKTFEAEDGYAPLTEDFHVYELDWNENNIVGKIDGITYYTLPIDGATMEEFLKDYFMILNVAVGGTLGNGQGIVFPAGDISVDWDDPRQTDMLVDWVEVYERVPATSGTLIDETGVNLSYNRIVNSAEFGGAFVESDLKSTAVTPLVGDQVMEINYSTTRSENGGGVEATYAGAIFLFNGIDLSDYDNFVFSIDTSAFPKKPELKDLTIQFEDNNNGAVFVHTSDPDYLLSVSGNWETYRIPLAHFAGVDIKNITAIGFFNPVDADGNLLAGTLYVDDIRFTRSTAECDSEPSVDFDSSSYNPNTTVGEISVSDPCAPSSLARVEIEK